MSARRLFALFVCCLWAAPARADYTQFVAQEARLQAAIAQSADPDAQSNARAELAQFYESEGLHVEALNALGAVRRADDDRGRLLAARAAYALGRWRDAIDALDDERLSARADATVLTAMAAAQLGAYERARAEFARGDVEALPSPDLRREARLLAAETDLFRGDLAAAQRTLDLVRSHAADRPDSWADYLEGVIALARGERAGRDALRRLAEAHGPFAARAALRLLLADIGAGAVSKADQKRRLDDLRLRWSGASFEREWLAAAATQLAESSPGDAIDAFRRLATRHSLSDAAQTAQASLERLLAQLVTRADLPPRIAARLFYENIEFAPRGSEGDALIRALADKLVRLDLLAEAAELLEHQTFKRLRGPLKSAVAADLAEIRLEEGRPAEALRALRATRLAGLDASLVRRRLLLEARALERTGAYDAALALLASTTEGAALELRANVEWRIRDFAAAARSYRLVALSAGGDPEKARNAALKAAAGFLLADDRQGLESWRREASALLRDVAETELLGAMEFNSSEDGDRFLAAYRRLFAAGG